MESGVVWEGVVGEIIVGERQIFGRTRNQLTQVQTRTYLQGEKNKIT